MTDKLLESLQRCQQLQHLLLPVSPGQMPCETRGASQLSRGLSLSSRNCLSSANRAAALQKAKPQRLPTVLLRLVHCACAPVGAVAQLCGEGSGGCRVVRPRAVTVTAF